MAGQVAFAIAGLCNYYQTKSESDGVQYELAQDLWRYYTELREKGLVDPGQFDFTRKWPYHFDRHGRRLSDVSLEQFTEFSTTQEFWLNDSRIQQSLNYLDARLTEMYPDRSARKKQDVVQAVNLFWHWFEGVPLEKISAIGDAIALIERINGILDDGRNELKMLIFTRNLRDGEIARLEAV